MKFTTSCLASLKKAKRPRAAAPRRQRLAFSRALDAVSWTPITPGPYVIPVSRWVE